VWQKCTLPTLRGNYSFHIKDTIVLSVKISIGLSAHYSSYTFCTQEILFVLCSRVYISWIYINICPTRCNYIQFIFICKLLSMVRRWRQIAVTVPLMPDAVDTVIWAPDDGWRYHPKHVLQFTDINKLYIVASCWTIIDIISFVFKELNHLMYFWVLRRIMRPKWLQF
jgi:hypothetical protein